MFNVHQKKSDEFCASEFVDNLLNEGNLIKCDESNQQFNKFNVLPPFYDENKFKRGQKFFYKHLYSMFFAKILGLITVLSVPDLAEILKFTRMSGEPLSAYRRYLATIFHMVAWYKYDFSPNSKIWKSIEKVKFKHNVASKRSCAAGLYGISQRNMALTQFGFMGYIICETETVGIYHATTDELESFVHVWKVMGYLMGMEDRFNICRDSLCETKEICTELVRRVFRNEVKKQHENYVNLSSALVNGMWCMMPVMNHNVFLYFINEIVLKEKYSIEGTNNNMLNNNLSKEENYKSYDLNIFQRFYLFCLVSFFSLMRFTVYRIFHVYNMYVVFWLMHNFPFLAYYKFGKNNSHVDIFVN